MLSFISSKKKKDFHITNLKTSVKPQIKVLWFFFEIKKIQRKLHSLKGAKKCDIIARRLKQTFGVV